MRWYLILTAMLLTPLGAFAQQTEAATEDTTGLQVDTTVRKGFVHRLELEAGPGRILHTNKYLKGDNDEGREMNHSFVAKAKYAFMHPRGSVTERIYGGAYQGVGVALHQYNSQLGNPVSAFIYQGARIATLGGKAHLNYEWNLGLTFGWHPYDEETNSHNRVIGSKVTAYIDADFYVAWHLAEQLDLNTGVELSHFSNGNTTIPNSGLNTIGPRLGLAYFLGRDAAEGRTSRQPLPAFHRHWSCEVLLWGAWRKTGYENADGAFALPSSYAVWGFSVMPLWNMSHWMNLGLSVDGTYDRSANFVEQPHIVPLGGSSEIFDPEWLAVPSAEKQMALGLSARAELVMPYFTIDAGLGHNVLCQHGGSLDAWYQVLALKTTLTRSLFLHIGYSLHNFSTPNSLMLGLGVRLGNQRK